MTLGDSAIQIFNQVCEKFGIVIDWTSNNVVPYLTQLMERIHTYLLVTKGIYLIIAIIGFFIFLIAGFKLFKYSSKVDRPKNSRDWAQVIGFCCWVVAIIFAIFAINFIFKIVEAVYLPEIVTMNYIKNFIPAT